MAVFIDNGGVYVAGLQRNGNRWCFQYLVQEQEYGSGAEQLNREVIQSCIFLIETSLADTCSVKRRIKLEISQFGVPPFTGENREKHWGT